MFDSGSVAKYGTMQPKPSIFVLRWIGSGPVSRVFSEACHVSAQYCGAELFVKLRGCRCINGCLSAGHMRLIFLVVFF